LLIKIPPERLRQARRFVKLSSNANRSNLTVFRYRFLPDFREFTRAGAAVIHTLFRLRRRSLNFG